MFKLIEYKFDDLYTMSSGISSKPEQAGHGSPFVSFATVFKNYFLPDNLIDFMDTSYQEQEVYSIKKGDIFLTRTSETIDELGMSCVATKNYPGATFSGFVKRLRPSQTDITYYKYMGFYLRSKFFRKTMTNNSIMTLRASLNEDIFSYLKLYLPVIEIQKNIGDFLFLLNTKIELNNRINAELESIAKILFDYWFIQFDFPDKYGKPYKSNGGKLIWNDVLKRMIPEGWGIGKFNNYLKILSGYPFDSQSYLQFGKYKIITIKNVQDSIIDTCNVEFINDLPENIAEYCKLSIGDILVSLTGNVGRVCIVPEENLLLNQRVGKFICEPKYLNYIYLLFKRPEERSRLEKIATGSSQKNLSPLDAVNSFCIYPDDDTLLLFNRTVDPIIKKMILGLQENQQLSSLRDWLLPMLMNGQVKVNNLFK